MKYIFNKNVQYAFNYHDTKECTNKVNVSKDLSFKMLITGPMMVIS